MNMNMNFMEFASSQLAAPKPEPGPEPDIDELDEDYESDDEDPNVFRVRDPLDEPLAEPTSIRKLHELIHNGLIDINPPYQRDVVWPDSKQMALIDSIFRNYYVPPIVFAVQKDEYGDEVRVCVDGKQRLTSIQKFIDGQIPHKDAKTKKNFWFTVPNSSQPIRTEIPSTAKEIFISKKIMCMEYHGITPGAERDIFQRVQMGMTLTAAEKLQAISSPWAEWISNLEARHVAVEGGLSHVLEWDTKRGRDFQNLAYLVYCCDGLPESEHIPTAHKMEKWLSRVDKPPEKFKTDVEEILRDFWNIASDPKLNGSLKNIGSRLAPVEFIFIGVLLFILRKRPIENRAAAIGHLRRGIRAQYKDIRNNSSVSKTLWTLVRELETDTSTTLYRGNGDSGKGKKRKKAQSDDEDEYRPTPVTSLGKTAKTRSKQSKKLE